MEKVVLVILQFEVGDNDCPFYYCKLLIDADQFNLEEFEDAVYEAEETEDDFEAIAETALEDLDWDYEWVDGTIPACEGVWIINL